MCSSSFQSFECKLLFLVFLFRGFLLLALVFRGTEPITIMVMGSDGLVTLCADKKVIFADSTPSFTLGDGSVNDGYLHRDGIHLTHAAVNRLAKSLRLKKRNDASGDCSGERKPQYQHPHPPTALNHGGDAEWTTVRR